MSERDIFDAALAIDDPAERAAYLDRACAGNPGLRQHLDGLLSMHGQAGSFLESPALAAATVDEPILEPPGTTIGPYKLLQQIGEGGMGTVFMAEQTHPVQRKVALKIIKPGMDSRQVIARFEAERQALALMDHPNIARVLDAGTTVSGRPYFVMELVKGVPITRYCDDHHLTPRQRLELFVPVCQAVQHAHQKGIIHRDLKPSNVLVAEYDDKPVAKVIDFGVAKATGPKLTDRTMYTEFGQVVGTLEYMSPEQAKLNALDIDTRTDIYALGVLLYELLTGTTPFDPERLRTAGYDEMRRIIREEEPPRPSTRISTLGQAATTVSTQRQSDPERLRQLFRRELDWIVMKALEKDRNRRYETASAFAADVQRYLGDEPVQACPPSAGYRWRKFARRNRGRLTMAAVVTGALVAVLAVLAGSVGWVVRDRAAQQAEMKRQVQDSLTAARDLLADNQVARARQKLAEATSRIGADRAPLGNVADEVEALDAELGKFERFLELVEQAHEAEFPQAVALALQSHTAGGTPVRPGRRSPERDAAKAIPHLLEALSCYGILEQDDWSARLEGGLLGPDQLARMRRTAYEELLWLADDLAHRRVDHRSGRKLSSPEAAQQALAYLPKAESALRPTTAFYQIRAACRKALRQEEEARKDLQAARQAYGAIALDHYLLAQAANDANNKAEAVQQCEAALRVEPTHYWSLLLLGNCLNLGQKEQDFVAATLAFTGCILKRPGHASAYFGRGYAYLMLRRLNEAVADYREGIRLRPDNSISHSNLGIALQSQGKQAEAEAEYRESLRLRPDFPDAHVNLGNALNEQGKHAQAEAEFRGALRLRDFPLARNGLGIALWGQGKHAAAVAVYREELRLWPDFPLGHFNLGNALANQGNDAEAEAEYRESLRLRADFPRAHLELGVVLARQSKHAAAVAEFREAVRLQPDYSDAHYNLGWTLYVQGKHAAAEAEYREALRLRPDLVSARVGLGNALYGQGKHAPAEVEYREALRLRPDDPGVLGNLGNALKDQGKLAAAEVEYRKALRLRPDDPGAHCNLGLGLQQQGRFTEALVALKRGHELGSQQPNWPHPSAEWVRQAEQLAALDSKLSKVLQGQVQPVDAAERIALAKLCREYKKRYVAAARSYAEAFAAEPKLAGDPRTAHRYNAACAAALAGCGQGEDAAKLDDAERGRLRRQALDWLRADLGTWGQSLDKEPEKTRATLQQMLRHWQQDTDLAGVRGDALAKLPEAERQPWQLLWHNVEQTLNKAGRGDAQDSKKKSPK